MRTILHGPVTMDHLADAALFSGIEPTSFVTDGLSSPPVEIGKSIPTDVFPLCPMQPEETRERARHYTLVQNADALVCVGVNEHLVQLAEQYELLVYEAAR